MTLRGGLVHFEKTAIGRADDVDTVFMCEMLDTYAEVGMGTNDYLDDDKMIRTSPDSIGAPGHAST